MELSSVVVHNAPAWREAANFIIAVQIDSSATSKDTEQIWARKISDDHFEICCIPFFAYDLALGDVVRTEPLGGRQFVVAEVTQPSGRYVFRVWFGSSVDSQDLVVRSLESLGALLEWSSANLLAVDARDQAHAQEVANFLQEQEGLDRLVYETGKLA